MVSEENAKRPKVHVRRDEGKVLVEAEGNGLSLSPDEAMSLGIELLRAAYSLRR